jgi:hypothetical protein
MKRPVSTRTRRELMAALGARYRSASRPIKRTILDEFVALTGYHRKHAIRALKVGKLEPAMSEGCSAA